MFQGRGGLTTTDLAFSVLAGQTAGGSSTINWMTCLKPPRWAREEWEQEAGMTGVASPAFDSFIDEVWSRLHVNVEESVVNPSNDVLRRGSEALGYRFGIDYDVIPRNAHGCGSRCDFCCFGGVYDAKQSSLVTYLPDANRAGARFLFDTKADHLIIQSGEVRGVEATFRNGAHSIPVHVRARTVVAAGSAIQTPALLLRSGIRSQGVGLGLRLDPTTALFGEFAAPSSTPSLTAWAVWAFEKTEWPCSPPIRWVPLGREPTRGHRLRNRRASRTMCGICGSAMEASCRPRRA